MGVAALQCGRQDNLHAAAVDLLHQRGKILVACLQIFLLRDAADIPRRLFIVLLALRQTFPLVPADHAEMRIDIVIVLDIVFMIGRRYKNRVQIDNLYTQILQVVQLFPDTAVFWGGALLLYAGWS